MERLTYLCNGEYRVNEHGVEYSGQSIDRLAAYENTGLEPKEVKSLDWERRMEEERTLAAMWGYGIDPDRLTDIIDAEKEGRLLVLPCKVGSKIYILRGDVRNGYETVKETHVEEVPFGLGCLDKQMKLYPFYYLTREEAEAKMKECGNE